MRRGPSLTARTVALTRSRLERPQTPTGNPDAEDRLNDSLRAPIRWPLSSGWQTRIATRTRFFDAATFSAIDRGISQIVILGAGYDGRALRFHQPGVRFFEVDHPATQQDKRRRLQELSFGTDAATYIAHDLAHGDLTGALGATGHASDRPSLFLCEGLLLYLSEPVVEQLFRDLRALAAPGSQLALSARESLACPSTTARANMAAQRLLLSVIGEPRRSQFGPGELCCTLEHAGWHITDQQARTHDAHRAILILAES